MELAVDHRTPLRSAPPSRHTERDHGRGQHRDSEALQAVLAELGDRVKPVVLARERTLPVSAAVATLLPDEGLMRGRVVSCRGAGAATTAFGLVTDALTAGAWMAVVDVSTFGADAAAEVGIPLERVVRVDTGTDRQPADRRHAGQTEGPGSPDAWVEVMAAAVDGFDIVVTSVPEALQGDRQPPAVRTLVKRIQRHGAVVVVLGEPGALASDVELRTVATVWSGLGAGDGRLRRRRIDIESSGRRLPGGRSGAIELIGEGPRVELVAVAPSPAVDERDPEAELLAEMAGVDRGSPRSVGAVRDLAEDDADHRLVG